MNGLELARGYYEEYGRPMLEKEFADLLPYLAVGYVGSGSERFGFDDEVSQDHDFEPGFRVFLPGEDVVDRRQEFLLERAYAKLPKEYMGVRRPLLAPVGGERNGIIRTADFYRMAVGSPSGELSAEAWLSIPDSALAEAVNGEVFFDNYGEFTKIRKSLMNMPEDIRLKRLAGNLLIMAQSGQYNYLRCIRHGEPEAAQLACGEFVNAAMKVFFLLNRRYMPYYKWSFRALRSLPEGEELAERLGDILFSDHRACIGTEDKALMKGEAERKSCIIEDIAEGIIGKLRDQGLTEAVCQDLEKHAYSVNDRITDGEIRSMHILAAV